MERTNLPSIGKWIKKLWYINTREYISAMKRNELLCYEKKETWRELKCILLSELKSQHAISFQNEQNYGGSKKIRGCQGFMGREGRREVHRISIISTTAHESTSSRKKVQFLKISLGLFFILLLLTSFASCFAII